MTKIRKPNELVVTTTVKTLIYGQAGIGKTTLSLSAPKPLLIDCDGGVHRLNPLHQTDTLQVESWNDILDVMKEDLSSYQTLVIDTAGKMLDYLTMYLIKNDSKLGRKDGALTLQGYGARKVAFVNFLKQVSVIGKHIVFVAHDREEKDGDYRFIRPEIGGSSAGDLIKELDLVGYMEASGKERTISFDPCEKFYGKNTCQLESLLKVSDVSNGGNTFLTDIIARYHASLEKRKELAEEYKSLIELIEANVQEASDEDTLNDFVDWAKGIQHIWDSKLVASTKVSAKAKEIGSLFNKETLKYEKEV
jgi:hypothetical protein